LPGSSSQVGCAEDRYKLFSPEGNIRIAEPKRIAFDAVDFLAKAGLGVFRLTGIGSPHLAHESTA
jgi:hypothetical protein